MPAGVHKNPQINVRLSMTGRACLKALQERDGLTQTAVFEKLLREKCRELKLQTSLLSVPVSHASGR